MTAPREDVRRRLEEFCCAFDGPSTTGFGAVVADIRTLLDDEERLRADAARQRVFIEPFLPGFSGSVNARWGKVLAWIVAGAPNRDEGIEAAAQINRWRSALADALSPVPPEVSR